MKYIGVDKSKRVYGYTVKPIRNDRYWQPLEPDDIDIEIDTDIIQALLCGKLEKGCLYKVTKTHLIEIDKL